MNSKERVRAAIARQPVDLAPLGLYAVDCDTASRVLGRPTFIRNKVEIQIALWEGRRDELAEGLKKDTVELYQKLDCVDLILPKEGQRLPPRDYEPERPKKIAEDTWQDKQGRIWQAARSSNDITIVSEPPVERKPCMEDFEKPLDVTPPDPSEFEVIDYVLERLGKDRYIPTWTGGTTVMTFLGGMEEGMVAYALEPEMVMAATRRQCDWQNKMDEYCIRPGAAGGWIEQDFAGTNGPLVSPATFRQMCLPFFKERVEHIKRFMPQVLFHACGNTIPIMDQIIEAGIDCYQSLQTTAGMELGKLMRMFGDRLCFWGGVPVETLIAGAPEETRKAVRAALEVGGRGGGFILGPSHSVAFGTKYDNFMAMLDEFVKLRGKF
ncbi:MAG TPA: uroporphyrinogen decarboxylase family protein [Candidatus Brocadiia bacterium]|nr:uroporphyrinogen decarboxylase family protein [Candidatus Brocadiia bacterium]